MRYFAGKRGVFGPVHNPKGMDMSFAKSIVYALCCVMLACGCAKKSQPDPVKVEYYPACHEPLAYLEQRSHVGSSVASGAMQGGVISGIAAGIIGAIAGGIRPAGILTSIGVGAAIGGVAGGVGGGSAQQKEDNAHLAAYLEQIDGDITGLDIVSAAATVSMQCYDREFRLLLDEVKAHSLTQSAAEARFEEIVAGREEAAKLLSKPADTETLQEEFLAAEKQG